MKPRPSYLLIRLFLGGVLLSQATAPAFSQTWPGQAIEEILEELSSTEDPEAGIEEIASDLYQASLHPININQATGAELASLHFLTPFQITSLLDYVEHHGPLGSIYEVAYIHGFDSQLAGWLEPFVYFGEQAEPLAEHAGKALESIRHSLLIRYTEVAGRRKVYREYRRDSLSRDQAPAGNPAREVIRYDLAAGHFLRGGLVAEKDPGEACPDPDGRALPDHLAGYLEINPGKTIRQICLGDFHLRLGQGLVAWTGFNPAGAMASIRKIPAGIRPFTSTEENRFFRGVGLNLSREPYSLIWMVSAHKQDARLNGEKFNSFLSDGIHATASQQATRKTVGEYSTGGSLRYKQGTIRLGLNWLATGWDREKIAREGPEYLFDLSGKGSLNASIDYQLSLPNLTLFGETAAGPGFAIANLHGLEWAPHDLVRMYLLFRHYSRAYQALYASAFSQSSATGNETGVFAGLSFTPAPGWEIIARHDQYRFPWLRYQVSAPSTGQENLLEINRSWADDHRLVIRYRAETREINRSGQEMKLPSPKSLEKHQWHIRYYASPLSRWKLVTRLGASLSLKADQDPGRGWVVGQDAGWESMNRNWSAWFRLALFDTDDYDSRLYIYEHDVWSAISFPAYAGQGMRYYALLHGKISQQAEAWFRWSFTDYRDRESTGSGWNEVPGPRRQEWSVQIRLHF